MQALGVVPRVRDELTGDLVDVSAWYVVATSWGRRSGGHFTALKRRGANSR
jgi:hypothetical protein